MPSYLRASLLAGKIHSLHSCPWLQKSVMDNLAQHLLNVCSSLCSGNLLSQTHQLLLMFQKDVSDAG